MLAFAKPIDGGYSVISALCSRYFEIELPSICSRSGIPVVVAPNIHDKLMDVVTRHKQILGILGAKLQRELKEWQKVCRIIIDEGLESGSTEALAQALAASQMGDLLLQIAHPWREGEQALYTKFAQAVEAVTNTLAEKQGYKLDGTEEIQETKVKPSPGANDLKLY